MPRLKQYLNREVIRLKNGKWYYKYTYKNSNKYSLCMIKDPDIIAQYEKLPPIETITNSPSPITELEAENNELRSDNLELQRYKNFCEGVAERFRKEKVNISILSDIETEIISGLSLLGLLVITVR